MNDCPSLTAMISLGYWTVSTRLIDATHADRMGASARVTAELRDVLGGRTRLTSAADLAQVCLVVTHVPLDGDLRVALHRRPSLPPVVAGW